MKKMALTLQKLIIQQNVQLQTPAHSLGLQSSLCQRKWKICVSHCEKMALTLQKLVIQQNFQLLTPPPPIVWVSSPLCIYRNGKFVSAIVKKWKNGPTLQKLVVK